MGDFPGGDGGPAAKVLAGLYKTLEFLLSSGNLENLFCVRIPFHEVLRLRRIFVHGSAIELGPSDIQGAAAVMLLLLKELKGFLLPKSLQVLILAAARISTPYSRLYVLRLLLAQLPAANYELLKHLAVLLSRIYAHNEKRISLRKLSVLVGPLLIQSENDATDAQRLQAVTMFAVALLKEHQYLFRHNEVMCHPVSSSTVTPHGQTAEAIFNRLQNLQPSFASRDKVQHLANAEDGHSDRQEISTHACNSTDLNLSNRELLGLFCDQISSRTSCFSYSLRKPHMGLLSFQRNHASISSHDEIGAEEIKHLCHSHCCGGRCKASPATQCKPIELRGTARFGDLREGKECLGIKKGYINKNELKRLLTTFMKRKQEAPGETCTPAGRFKSRMRGSCQLQASCGIHHAQLRKSARKKHGKRSKRNDDGCNKASQNHFLFLGESPHVESPLPSPSSPSLPSFDHVPPPPPTPPPLPPRKNCEPVPPPPPPRPRPPPHPPPPPPPPPPPRAPPPPTPQTSTAPRQASPPPPPPPPVSLQHPEASPTTSKKPKLKQLVWDKITTMAAETVWAKTGVDGLSVDIQQLESLFAVNLPPPKEASQTALPKTPKVAKIHLIDFKRAHNISIQLSSLRKPFLELCRALIEMDEKALTTEALAVMHRTLPTKEDILLLNEYKGDVSLLADVERYYMEIIKISRIEKRIQVFIFKQQYNNIVQVKNDFQLLERACNQLRESKTFVRILEMVLAVGNYLNGDSYRGAAKGFKLDTLLKLMDVKGSNKKTTLLHFVVSELHKTDAQVVKLSDELKEVTLAANLSLDRMQASLREFEYGVQTVEEEVNVASLHNNQHFQEAVISLLKQAKSDKAELKDLEMRAMGKFKDLATYLGEDTRPEKQTYLFRTMREFLNMFDCVNKEVQRYKSRQETAPTSLSSLSTKKSFSKRPITFPSPNSENKQELNTELEAQTRDMGTRDAKGGLLQDAQAGDYDSDWSTG